MTSGRDQNTVRFSCLGSVYIGSDAADVAASIQSLLCQLVEGDEIILVQDGPVNNNLRRLLNEYKNSNSITLVRSSQNLGLARALNKGLSHCANKYIIRFDSDDLNVPYRLSVLAEYIQINPTVDVFGSFVYEFTGHSQQHMCSLRMKTLPTSNHRIRQSLTFINALNHPSVCFNKETIASLGGYTHLPLFEDYYLWLKVRANPSLLFLNIPIPLVFMSRSGTLERRSGTKYFVLELQFAIRSYGDGYLGIAGLIACFFKACLRLLPTSFQFLQNCVPWRGKSVESLNPIHFL